MGPRLAGIMVFRGRVNPIVAPPSTSAPPAAASLSGNGAQGTGNRGAEDPGPLRAAVPLVFRCLRGVAVLLAAAALALHPRAGDPAPLAGQWSQGVHRIGDRVLLTVAVPIPEAQYFVAGTLAPGTLWGDTRVAASRQVPPPSLPGNLSIQITVQAFGIGPARLTPVPITVNTSGGTTEYLLQPPPLEIAPLLQEGEGPPPFLPPLPYPRPFPWAILLGALGLAVVAAVLIRWALAKSGRSRLEGPAPVKPQEADPDRWIRDEVERIFRTDAVPRVKYGLLSLRLREYLALRTSLPFPDWTTDECARGSARSPLLGEVERDRLAKSLRLCDLAKFARYAPLRQEEESARAEVRGLLDGVSQNLQSSRKEGAA